MKMKPFFPSLLPLEKDCYNIDDVLEILLRAIEKMTELKGVIKNSKLDTSFLILPLLNQEATSSTRIEGTQITIDGVYESQADKVKKSTDKNVQEALNYMGALDYGEDYIESKGKMTKGLIREMHKILMSNGVRGGKKNPGEFKKGANYIGAQGAKIENAEFIPPGPEHTEGLIDNLIEYINSDKDDFQYLLKIAVIHAQFETIHPFADGNGRIGRVLIPLFLYQKKVIDVPFFFLSKILEKNQFQYYQRLNDTRWPQKWSQWFVFFLKSVEEQAEETIELVEKLGKLFDRDMEILKTKHKHLQMELFLKEVYSSPIFTAKRIVERAGINYTTCREYINTLLENERISNNRNKRNTIYYHYEILEYLR